MNSGVHGIVQEGDRTVLLGREQAGEVQPNHLTGLAFGAPGQFGYEPVRGLLGHAGSEDQIRGPHTLMEAIGASSGYRPQHRHEGRQAQILQAEQFHPVPVFQQQVVGDVPRQSLVHIEALEAGGAVRGRVHHFAPCPEGIGQDLLVALE